MKKLLLLVGILAALNVLLFSIARSNRPAERQELVESSFRLQWDRSPDRRVVEYRIYIATQSGDYTFDDPAVVVPSDVTEWPLRDLAKGRYFAIVTAATATEESPPTAEIEFTIP